MDGQTDGQTDIPPLAIPAVCIARYANALVKKGKRKVKGEHLCSAPSIDIATS